ncbi:hypothetical protein J6590_031387 [Homalodisca vitripennis]|nr:hypothetical protein J6590_031387 [Homalodisca vitripennis]
MSAKRLRDDEEDVNDFVHRILEEALSTDRMHGSNEWQDEEDFENSVSAVSSELFGDYDSDMDPKYLPSGNSSEYTDDSSIIDQDQLNQQVQLPNILKEPENAIHPLIIESAKPSEKSRLTSWLPTYKNEIKRLFGLFIMDWAGSNAKHRLLLEQKLYLQNRNVKDYAQKQI